MGAASGAWLLRPNPAMGFKRVYHVEGGVNK